MDIKTPKEALEMLLSMEIKSLNTHKKVIKQLDEILDNKTPRERYYWVDGFFGLYEELNVIDTVYIRLKFPGLLEAFREWEQGSRKIIRKTDLGPSVENNEDTVTHDELSRIEKVKLIEEVRARKGVKSYSEAINIASEEAGERLYKNYDSFKTARHEVREYL